MTTPIRQVMTEMFARPAPSLFEAEHQSLAEFQANLHEAYADLLAAVHRSEAGQRTEDRIDAAIWELRA
jgi:hypothetical protein